KRNHPGSKLRQGFWMVFRLGVNNWGLNKLYKCKKGIFRYSRVVTHFYKEIYSYDSVWHA
ncbi:hypothetical protein V2O11_09020, partial [Streptococcus pneumoniae]